MGSQLKGLKPELQVHLSDPVILDRWLDVAYIALFASYGIWGVTTALIGLPTVSGFTNGLYQLLWSGAIGIIALNAAFMAFLVFFKTSWMRQVTKKRLELASVIALIPFIVLYPILLVIRIFYGEGDLVGGTTVLGISYLIFPVLRVWILRGRIRKLTTVLVAVPKDAP
jgi:hypothetical protein